MMTKAQETIGCEYCDDTSNRLIDGLGGDSVRMICLLECPRCGQYYHYCGAEPQYRPPLTFDEAAAHFPDDFRSGRPHGSLSGCSDGSPSAVTVMLPAWRTSTVVALAQQMYDARDFAVMPILGDALQDAGCDSDDILDHCRGPGPHVRGCWVVDLVPGKS
jgi:hypothetical protein